MYLCKYIVYIEGNPKKLKLQSVVWSLSKPKHEVLTFCAIASTRVETVAIWFTCMYRSLKESLPHIAVCDHLPIWRILDRNRLKLYVFALYRVNNTEDRLQILLILKENFWNGRLSVELTKIQVLRSTRYLFPILEYI